MIPNCGERRRYGEAVSTAFVESTVNQVVAKRFAKKQQMQWTPRGVHLLVQLRVRTLDGTLANDFRRWRDERKAAGPPAFLCSQLDQVTELPEGLRVHVPHAKGDQLGRGATVIIPDRKRIEPVQLYRAWLRAAPILDGFVFRKLTPQGRLTTKPMSDKGVALVVKARAASAGHDPELFSGHSLRAGFLTEAGRQGANLFKMKDHSRHKSLEMVGEYVRDHEAFRDHAGDKFL